MRLSSLSKYVKCCLLCSGYERKGPKGDHIMQMEQIPFLLSRASPPPTPPSWQLTVLSLCFSQCWQFFQWSKLGHIRKWKQLSALYWETCLLYCKDEGPRILDTLSPLPPLYANTINIQTHTSSAWTVFCSDWQHLARANLKNTYYTLPGTQTVFPY